MHWVSYRRKRDKRIVLSSDMISWEFTAVNLSFCKHCIFSHAIVYPFFFRLFSYEHWRTNYDLRTTKIPKSLVCLRKKLRHKMLKYFSKCFEIGPYCTRLFGVNIKRVRQTVSPSSVDCLNDHKSCRHKKGECLEDYHWRFGHAEILHKNCAKKAEWYYLPTPPLGQDMTQGQFF